MSASEANLSLARRLWVYQAERIPLGKTALLLAIFSAASINVSAILAGRDLPGWGAYLSAFGIVLILFIQLRVCDEVKDREIDARYRPERPVPRGLVSLNTIVGIGTVLVLPAALFAYLYFPPTLWLLALVWLWLGLMSAEFFVGHWLSARPVLYLVSHMAIMPLMDLLLTGVEWLPQGGPPQGLWLFLVLSFVNGCILEIGRKAWAPENEREGVETYSSLWGVRRTGIVWTGLIGLSFVCLALVGGATGHIWAVIVPGLVGVIVCMITVRRYVRAPDNAAQKQMDTVAGLWVFTCYGAAGFAPLIAAWLG